jgi:hypothetical protein
VILWKAELLSNQLTNAYFAYFFFSKSFFMVSVYFEEFIDY